MKQFKLYLGRMIVLETEGKEHARFDPESKVKVYKYIAFGRVDKEGQVLEIAFQPCHAESLVKSLEDDHLFTSKEVHIEVWKYQEEKLFEFDGTLHDAIVVAAEEGGRYDV